MYSIENDVLLVGIDAKGAELKSVVVKETGLDYMWSADPDYWAKTSPVLFPIVGALKDNQYSYKGQTYPMTRHGFARDKSFSVTAQETSSITFTLESNGDTLVVYPFPFRFSIIYSLQETTLSVTYVVENRGEEELLFSVGGHPAFAVPLVKGTTYNDYVLQFNKAETAGRWPITKEGLIGAEPEPLLQNETTLPLTKALFAKDAIVLKHLQSDRVTLQSGKTPHGLRFSFDGFPYLGLWAAPGANFVCIEPWCGIADSVQADGELAHKEGINGLPAGEIFERTWRVTFY